MTDKNKIRIVVDEDIDVVERIDAIAEREGTTRAAVVRRIIRAAVLSLPTILISENTSSVSDAAPAFVKDVRRNKAEKCYEAYVNERCIGRGFERYAEAEAYADKYVFEALTHGAVEVA